MFHVQLLLLKRRACGAGYTLRRLKNLLRCVSMQSPLPTTCPTGVTSTPTAGRVRLDITWNNVCIVRRQLYVPIQLAVAGVA